MHFTNKIETYLFTRHFRIKFTRILEQLMPNHMLMSTWKRTLKSNQFQLKMKGNMEKLHREKGHLPRVHKRGNIERETACMKMMVLKSCLNSWRCSICNSKS